MSLSCRKWIFSFLLVIFDGFFVVTGGVASLRIANQGHGQCCLPCGTLRLMAEAYKYNPIVTFNSQGMLHPYLPLMEPRAMEPQIGRGKLNPFQTDYDTAYQYEPDMYNEGYVVDYGQSVEEIPEDYVDHDQLSDYGQTVEESPEDYMDYEPRDNGPYIYFENGDYSSPFVPYPSLMAKHHKKKYEEYDDQRETVSQPEKKRNLLYQFDTLKHDHVPQPDENAEEPLPEYYDEPVPKYDEKEQPEPEETVSETSPDYNRNENANEEFDSIVELVPFSGTANLMAPDNGARDNKAPESRETEATPAEYNNGQDQPASKTLGTNEFNPNPIDYPPPKVPDVRKEEIMPTLDRNGQNPQGEDVVQDESIDYRDDAPQYQTDVDVGESEFSDFRARLDRKESDQRNKEYNNLITHLAQDEIKRQNSNNDFISNLIQDENSLHNSNNDFITNLGQIGQTHGETINDQKKVEPTAEENYKNALAIEKAENEMVAYKASRKDSSKNVPAKKESIVEPKNGTDTSQSGNTPSEIAKYPKVPLSKTTDVSTLPDETMKMLYFINRISPNVYETLDLPKLPSDKPNMKEVFEPSKKSSSSSSVTLSAKLRARPNPTALDAMMLEILQGSRDKDLSKTSNIDDLTLRTIKVLKFLQTHTPSMYNQSNLPAIPADLVRGLPEWNPFDKKVINPATVNRSPIRSEKQPSTKLQPVPTPARPSNIRQRQPASKPARPASNRPHSPASNPAKISNKRARRPTSRASNNKPRSPAPSAARTSNNRPRNPASSTARATNNRPRSPASNPTRASNNRPRSPASAPEIYSINRPRGPASAPWSSASSQDNKKQVTSFDFKNAPEENEIEDAIKYLGSLDLSKNTNVKLLPSNTLKLLKFLQTTLPTKYSATDLPIIPKQMLFKIPDWYPGLEPLNIRAHLNYGLHTLSASGLENVAEIEDTLSHGRKYNKLSQAFGNDAFSNMNTNYNEFDDNMKKVSGKLAPMFNEYGVTKNMQHNRPQNGVFTMSTESEKVFTPKNLESVSQSLADDFGTAQDFSFNVNEGRANDRVNMPLNNVHSMATESDVHPNSYLDNPFHAQSQTSRGQQRGFHVDTPRVLNSAARTRLGGDPNNLPEEQGNIENSPIGVFSGDNSRNDGNLNSQDQDSIGNRGSSLARSAMNTANPNPLAINQRGQTGKLQTMSGNEQPSYRSLKNFRSAKNSMHKKTPTSIEHEIDKIVEEALKKSPIFGGGKPGQASAKKNQENQKKKSPFDIQIEKMVDDILKNEHLDKKALKKKVSIASKKLQDAKGKNSDNKIGTIVGYANPPSGLHVIPGTVYHTKQEKVNEKKSGSSYATQSSSKKYKKKGSKT